jgi:hypothetical protein
MSAGKNHHHQNRADREWCERRGLADRDADRENEEEGADELDDIFFHGEWKEEGRSTCAGRELNVFSAWRTLDQEETVSARESSTLAMVRRRFCGERVRDRT